MTFFLQSFFMLLKPAGMGFDLTRAESDGQSMIAGIGKER